MRSYIDASNMIGCLRFNEPSRRSGSEVAKSCELCVACRCSSPVCLPAKHCCLEGALQECTWLFICYGRCFTHSQPSRDGVAGPISCLGKYTWHCRGSDATAGSSGKGPASEPCCRTSNAAFSQLLLRRDGRAVTSCDNCGFTIVVALCRAAYPRVRATHKHDGTHTGIAD